MQVEATAIIHQPGQAIGTDPLYQTDAASVSRPRLERE